MSKGGWRNRVADWRLAIFAVAGVLAILVIGWLQRPQEIPPELSNLEGDQHPEREAGYSGDVTCNANCQVIFRFGGEDQDHSKRADHPANEDRYSAEQIALADFSEQRRMAHWTIVVAFLTAYGAILLVLTLKATADATNAAVLTENTTREIGETQLRAYVFMQELKRNYIADENEVFKRLEFMPFWMNQGGTPALNVVTYGQLQTGPIHTSRIVEYSAPADFKFGDATSFGPKTPIVGLPVSLDMNDLQAAWSGLLQIRYWVWIEYNDIFPDSPRRRTENEYRILVVHDPTTMRPDGIRFEHFGPLNGFDDQCYGAIQTDKHGNKLN